MQNISFWAHSPNGRRDTVLQWDTSIAAWGFHNLLYIYKDACRSFWYHLPPPALCSTLCHFSWKQPSDFIKCHSLGTPFPKGNGMLYCKERQQLLVKCLITFLIYKWIIGRASGSIYKPVMVNTMPVLPKTTLKFMQNISFWATSQNRKLDAMLQGEICIGDKCLITFLRCMNIIGGASASIYKPLMAQAQRHFCKNRQWFFMQNIIFQFQVPSLHKKHKGLLQGEMFIADQVFHNLP